MDPIFTSIGSIVALGLGAWLKAKPDFSNKLIPWVTLLISFLTQLSSAVGTPAHAASGFVGDLGSMFLEVLKGTLVQWLLTTGAHSTVKNAVLKK